MEDTKADLIVRHETLMKQVLMDIFMKTYSEILIQSEVEKRVDFLISKKDEIPPVVFYKNILFSMTDNELGKLAIDFRIQFVSDNYKNVIETANSYELDNFVFSESDLLNEEIEQFCIVISSFISNKILGTTNISIEEMFGKLSEVVTISFRRNKGKILNLNNEISHFVSLNQLIFSVVFNQDIYTGLPVNEKVVEKVSFEYENRVKLMNKLKEKYKTSISLEKVRNVKFFG